MASKLPTVSTGSENCEWKTENYSSQKKKYWPPTGKHILAQYDENTVVVYQAYKPSIAGYAVENKRFGGPDFSYSRMSWIKTNFLWMMYRCGWASKKNQERILAVRITREGFDTILANAYTAAKSKGVEHIEVRLQWDPDHSPSYEKLQRKAIQLGLKGKILERYGTEWIVDITDITDFCKEQHAVFEQEGNDSENFLTASERLYHVENVDTASQIGVDLNKD